MDMLTDKEEKRISGGQCQYHRPPRTGTETFRQNREESYTKERSGSKTNQRAKRLVGQSQHRADRSASEGENVSRDDLPEYRGHSAARDSSRHGMVFATVLRLDGDVNQFAMSAEQLTI